MTILVEQRMSDSSYIESVMQGQTTSEGSSVRPAECCWHMVFVRAQGTLRPLVVGPWTTAGTASWGKDGAVLWIKFRPGVFMPHMPFRELLDRETPLPEGAGHSFWLKSSTWELPSYENVETFIEQLAKEEILVRDELVSAVLAEQPTDLSPRTVRHRFQRATGLSQNQIYQVKRAQRAAELLQQGTPILDTVDEAGYYDQPHLTRALRQWVGYTPAQILNTHQSE